MKIIGDIHAKFKLPFIGGIYNLFNWLLSLDDDIFIFCGDLFDVSGPVNDLRKIIGSYLLKFKKVYILNGNHDYSRKLKSAILPLDIHENIIVILEPTVIQEEGLNILLLPYKYNMSDYENHNDEYDYIITHVTPTQCAFKDEGLDLKYRGIYVHGHTHIQTDFIDKYNNQHHVLGVPIPTRHLEEQQDHRIMDIKDKNDYSFISVPQTFTYETLKFGEFPENVNNILNIIDAPTRKDVGIMYKEFFIRDIQLQETTFVPKEINSDDLSIQEKFILLAKDRNINNDVVTKILHYLENV